MKLHRSPMAGVDDYQKKSMQQQQSAATTRWKLMLLLLLVVISTNALTIFLFSGHRTSQWSRLYAPAIHLWDSEALVAQLNATQSKLSSAQSQLEGLRTRLTASNSLFETLLAQLGHPNVGRLGGGDEDGWRDELPAEARLAVGPHKLPLGFTANLDSGELYPSLGSACRRYRDELVRYLSYEVGGECPADDVFAQRLLLKGCEPLPRRRCHPRSPKGYAGPVPFPESLWTVPPDASITWDAYTCKNYSCLVNRGRWAKGHYDCKDCFDLSGRERRRWLLDGPGIDYGIDAVLATRPPGTVRVGLDIGGGSGTFAARMRERNVTVATSTMNFDGPFNSFIASRGLLAMHVSVASRLPFFDNTLDIVHSMHVLSNWVPDAVLEFALYDVYRVLRPGGLFWLDHFFCVGTQLQATYAPMFGRIGFRRLRWNAGRKLDKGAEKNEWYLSALLEKPMT